MAEVKIEKLANEFEAAISIWLMSVFLMTQQEIA